MKLKNGTQPAVGSYVYASKRDCPSRYLWQRVGNSWLDPHGCRVAWEELVEPIDTLPPEA